MKQKFKLYVDSFIRHKELRKLNYRSGIVGFLSMTIEVRMYQFQYSIIGKMTFLRSRLYDHENGFLGIWRHFDPFRCEKMWCVLDFGLYFSKLNAIIETFVNVGRWLNDCRIYGHPSIDKLILGNKSDSSSLQMVTQSSAKACTIPSSFHALLNGILDE